MGLSVGGSVQGHRGEKAPRILPLVENVPFLPPTRSSILSSGTYILLSVSGDHRGSATGNWKLFLWGEGSS